MKSTAKKIVAEPQPQAAAPKALALADGMNFRDFYNEGWIQTDRGGMRSFAFSRLANSECALDAARGLLRILITDSDHRDTAKLCGDVVYTPLGNREVHSLLAAVEVLLDSSAIELCDVRENLPGGAANERA